MGISLWVRLMVRLVERKKEKLPWGARTIRTVLYFWTDELPTTTDKKTGWARGTIALPANKHRGIEADEIKFNDKTELLSKLQELLDRNKIKLIRNEKVVEDRLV